MSILSVRRKRRREVSLLEVLLNSVQEANNNPCKNLINVVITYLFLSVFVLEYMVAVRKSMLPNSMEIKAVTLF